MNEMPWFRQTTLQLRKTKRKVTAQSESVLYLRRKTLCRMSGQNSLTMLLRAADSIWSPQLRSV